jgi:hypothetical protein
MSIGLKLIVIFFGSVLILLVLWLGVPAYQKERADSLVRENCVKDGGLKVHEKVFLPEIRFSKSGMLGFLPPLKESAKPDDEYFFAWETSWLMPEASWAPSVRRNHQKLYRRSDEKLLGEAISYSRRGGDPVGPWHPSSFLCPLDADITVLVNQVFLVQR